MFCPFAHIILRGMFVDLHGLPFVDGVAHCLCMIVGVLQSVCRSRVACRANTFEFVHCLFATTVSMSPPGGNQVDGLPPVASIAVQALSLVDESNSAGTLVDGSPQT